MRPTWAIDSEPIRTRGIIVKYTTRKIHTKLYPELEWRIFHILDLSSEDIDDFTDIKFAS